MKIWAPRAGPQQGEGWYPEATPTGPHVSGHTRRCLPPSGRNTKAGCICIGTRAGIRLGVDKMVCMRFLLPLLMSLGNPSVKENRLSNPLPESVW